MVGQPRANLLVRRVHHKIEGIHGHCDEPLLVVDDRDINVNIWLDTDSCDLLDSLWWSMEVNNALVNPELEVIVGLSTVTARGTPGCDP